MQINAEENPIKTQRKRDDNRNKIRTFQGGVGQGGREENGPKRYFSWETPRQYIFESENSIVEKFSTRKNPPKIKKFI